MTQLIQQYILVLLSVFMASACSAQTKAPSDQVIEGVFEISNEWQIFAFEKPLNTDPFIQYFKLISCNERYSLTKTNIDEKRFFLLPDRFQDKSTNEIIEPEISINVDGQSYSLFLTNSGYYNKGDLNGCIFLGYNARSEKNQFHLPENITIDSVNVRANKNISIDFFHWHASDFWKAPDFKWSNLNPSKIIDLNDLPE